MNRVLIVLNYYYPYISGVSEQARLFAEALTEDYAVTVLTGQHELHLPLEEKVNGVQVIRAPLCFHLHKGYISSAFFRRYIELSRKSDIIHLHLPMLEAGPFSLFTPSRKLLVTYSCDGAFVGGVVDRCAIAAVRWSASLACARAKHVCVLAEDYACGSPVVKRYRDKWKEIYPPAKVPQVGDRPVFACDESCLNIGFVGRFVKEKGLDVLLEAMSRLAQVETNAVLHLVGEQKAVAGGGIFDEIAGKIKELAPRVKLYGRLSETDLWSFYRGLDILVLPSVNEYEAYGMVQVEAMMAGALVVASNLRGVRVPIMQTKNGVLVEPGNAEALVKGILACRELRKKLSRASVSEKALAELGAERSLEKYKRILSEMLNDGTA